MIPDIPPSSLLNIPVQAAADVSTWKVFLTIFLVFLNGFFVAAEFAIVKVRMSQLEIRTDINKRIMGVSKHIVNHLDSHLAATQLGITLASLGLGWVGESTMTALILNFFNFLNLEMTESVARSISIPVAFAVITVLHIVFGELAPKSIAIRHPLDTTVAVAWPLRIFYLVFKPVIWLMNGFANGLLRMIGMKPIQGSEIHSEEELKMIITESQEGGAIEATERELIQNVFEFDDRRVYSIQTLRKNISAIDLSTSVKEALDYAINEGYSRYPVYKDSLDNIKGLVYTRDLIKEVISNPSQTRIQPILRKAFYVSENSKIKNLLNKFQRNHIQMAIVTNEIGELSGIVTLEDILEELVGEIQDEYDNETPIVERIDDVTFLIDAHSSIADINKHLPFKLDESELYDTLAGLIAEKTEGREPKEGDVVTLNDYKALIVKMYRNSTEEVRLTLRNHDNEEDSQSDED
ncbi:MAG: hemolysin family protein [Flavobacteriaceae bacterium]|nr:hemolysin family protein [Flavobacteriaceae bacterium]